MIWKTARENSAVDCEMIVGALKAEHDSLCKQYSCYGVNYGEDNDERYI